MDIKALSEKYDSYIIERRRFYHTCPEASLNEVNTRASIKKDLQDMGITDITEMKTCYGLIATIHGGKKGKTVAIRADIDALPIEEKTGLPFASTNGYMHACGHDTHIAVLLGAAKMLNEIKDELTGDVRLIVQPAEECCKGAKMMVDEGAMKGVDAIYGSHTWGNLSNGKFAVDSGVRMSSLQTYKINVEGVSAHGSAPNLGVDAITVAAAIVENLQEIVSRQSDPLTPGVVTIGAIHGGVRFNVIANHVTMEGSCRTFMAGTWMEDHIRKIVEDTAKVMGATATVDDYYYGTTPIDNNHEDLNNIVRNIVKNFYGEDAIEELPSMMASEDFSWYMDEVPGVFTFLGARDPENGYIYTNHHEKFTVNEEILHRGAAVMAQFAVDFLNK